MSHRWQYHKPNNCLHCGVNQRHRKILPDCLPARRIITHEIDHVIDNVLLYVTPNLEVAAIRATLGDGWIYPDSIYPEPWRVTIIPREFPAIPQPIELTTPVAFIALKFRADAKCFEEINE